MHGRKQVKMLPGNIVRAQRLSTWAERPFEWRKLRNFKLLLGSCEIGFKRPRILHQDTANDLQAKTSELQLATDKIAMEAEHVLTTRGNFNIT